jgi:ribosomal protein S18 acetylase RimI-like enzyme
VEIRVARPEEYDRVGAITVAAYASFLLGPTDPYVARLRDVAGRAAVADLWVAVEGDTVLGSVTEPPAGSAYRELGGDDDGEFRMLAVAPEAQGRGVGELLARHVIDRSRAAGHRAVVISSLPAMTAAHRLYGRLGFVRLPELDWSPAPGVSLLAFRLELS